MEVAIPTFGHRVSPQFDSAPTIDIVEIREGQVVRGESGQALLALLAGGPQTQTAARRSGR